jgi:replicative DNA helicase
VVTSDINLATNGEERLAHYTALSELDGQLRGIPSGFPFIDHALQGFEPRQLITLVGAAKSGKSSSMLLMSKAANEAGYEPLLVGFEMSNREQYERLDAIRAKISHARLRNGSLTVKEWRQLQRAIKAQALLPDFHMTQDANSVMTLTGLRTKIEKINPDIVFVDGVYLMQDEHGEPGRSAAALSNLTAGLKVMAQQLEKPIVIATQALESKMSGKKLSTSSIGYSSTFFQDSDAVIGAEQTEDKNVTCMKILGARNAPTGEAYYEWNWDPVSFRELEGNPFKNDIEVDEEKARKYDW